jgi:hypothetical protein
MPNRLGATATRVALLAAILALSAVPAGAAGLTGMGKAIFGNTFNFAKPNLPKAPVGPIAMGPLKLELQRTRLADVQKALGGSIREEGADSSRAVWLCYNAEGGTAWFISNPLGGFEFVMMVAAEASAKPAKDCDAAPAGVGLPDFGAPGVGASLAELKAAFGTAGGSKIAYRSDRPGGYSDIAQYLGYVLKGGKVAGIGVGETSVPTQH